MACAKILLAEDCDHDVMLLQETFRMIGGDVSFCRVSDGNRVLEACSPESGRSFELIVLDHCLPRLTASQIVGQLAAWDVLSKVPVVVLSSHLSDEEIQRLKDLGVALAAEKPSDLEELCALARRMLALVKV